MVIGAVWLKEKDGKKFFSCQIEVPGLHLNFAIFKNDKKEKDNQPDYNIVWSPPKKQNDNYSTGGSPDEVPPVGEEIPF